MIPKPITDRGKRDGKRGSQEMPRGCSGGILLDRNPNQVQREGYDACGKIRQVSK